MKILITRHAQVLPTKESSDHLAGDTPLSELGIKQADDLMKRLKESGFKGNIYSSPLRRAAATAHIIALGLGLKVVIRKEIQEIVRDKNRMEGFKGATLSELAEEFDTIDDSFALDYPWWVMQEETLMNVAARVKPLVEDTIKKGVDTLFVGHGASVSALINVFLSRFDCTYPTKGARGWNCGLTVFDIGKKFKVESLCDVSHMDVDIVTSNNLFLKDELKYFSEI
jgi:broad specificity phosphatase PhoE